VTGARLLARTVRGLEHLVAAEVAAIGRVERIRHREVWFTAPPTPAVLGLRTADDVFLIGGTLHGLGHTRADLARVSRAAARLPVDELLALRSRCGGPAAGPGTEVVASFLGRRNGNRYDLEDAAGAALPGYVSRRHHRPPANALSWRLTVVDREAVLALRVAGRPLHRRAYRTRSVPGGLHPPVAAALVRLAGVTAGMTVLDPCCGAGTLLLESPGHRLGLDVSPDALACARSNGQHAVARADAGLLPVASGSVDRVLVNPPWDRQAHPRGRLAADPNLLWREVRRVLRPDGVVAAVVPAPELPGLRGRAALPVRVAGRLVWLVTGGSRGTAGGCSGTPTRRSRPS
jgi:tRNA (guanine6-N2)-methyltransferase